MIRRITIYSGEDGYWVVECPSLPGCVSQGKTQEEGLPVPLENVETLENLLLVV